jgi:predicted metal-dependent phosphoesterase TrpH
MPSERPVRRRTVLRAAGGGLAATLASAGASAVTDAPSPGSTPLYADTDYRLRVGDPHSHTAYSDGAPDTRPADAYAAGRDAGLDFKAVTDHSEWLPTPVHADEACLDPRADRLPTDCVHSPTDDPGGYRKWQATREQAAAATTEEHLALPGFEWSSPYQGHVVVHGTEGYATALETSGATMHGFWEWFTRDPAIGGGSDGIAFFAHPGREPETFEDFRYVPAAADRVVGCEVFNRDDRYFEGGLAAALDAGWRVGAVGSTDNHSADLYRPDRPKTVLVAPGDEPWTRETLEATLRDRRFYATYNETLQLRVTADGREMGSEVTAPPGSNVDIRVDVFDPADENAVEAIVLYTNGATEAARTTLEDPDRGASLTHGATAPADGTRWFVAEVLGPAGREGPDRGSAFASPVWVTGA